MLSKEYKAIKNFMHHEVGLHKADIKCLFERAIADEAKAYAKRYIEQNPPEEVVQKYIMKEVTTLISGSGYSSTQNKFFENIGKEVAKQLKVELK